MITGNDHPKFGSAKNSWLTGTASWTLKAATEWILLDIHNLPISDFGRHRKLLSQNDLNRGNRPLISGVTNIKANIRKPGSRLDLLLITFKPIFFYFGIRSNNTSLYLQLLLIKNHQLHI